MNLPDDLQGRALSPRQLLRYFGMLGAGAVVNNSAAAWAASSRGARLVGRAASTKAAGSDLGAIDHIVFLMMENRSYDHYFGDYPRGRGFNDHPAHSLGVFAQTQGGGSQPASYYYPGISKQESGVPEGHRTTVGIAGSALATTKSAYNHLTKVSS